MIWQIFYPLSAFALTSGPSQPEARSFSPVGMTDMVDMASGDFKYNLPLMEVGGYPINLNYNSGSGMDDEASWVGLGWNLNVGSISRQVKGIPDDANGDLITTTHFNKPKVTVGGKGSVKAEIFGFEKLKLRGTIALGLFNDSYTGIGAEFGVNTELLLGSSNDNPLTVGLGLSSHTSDGVGVQGRVSLPMQNQKSRNLEELASLSTSLGYNTRSGLKSLYLGASYSNANKELVQTGMSFDLNTPSIIPKIQIPYRTSFNTISVGVGYSNVGIYWGAGMSGYRSVRDVISNEITGRAYGFLYAENGKDSKSAIKDFIREKDNPIIKELPNLAVPIPTPDVFTFNTQKGSGQFRFYRGGTGIFNDNEAIDVSNVNTLHTELGFGSDFHFGTNFNRQAHTTRTGKWIENNNYLDKGDFQGYDKKSPNDDYVYLRQQGELGAGDVSLRENIGGDIAVSPMINGISANNVLSGRSLNKLVSEPIRKQGRTFAKNKISYLTVKETRSFGLLKNTDCYNFIEAETANTAIASQNFPKEQDLNAQKQDHHIGEITITESDNSRQVYGMPVYNKKQEEYSFALGKEGIDYQKTSDGKMAIMSAGQRDISRKRGIDGYFHVESQLPYASAFMLTGILSPDYVDQTGNGISADDSGDAIKFNYSKIANFKWRAPFPVKEGGVWKTTSTLNRGLLADPEDDKGSVVYGEKEICYIHSIESKEQVAYFITELRQDALGVTGWDGSLNTDIKSKQRRLKEIRLYSKRDLTTPIKVVKFQYDYSICPNIPNFDGNTTSGNGKLTLKKVWFEFKNTNKGANHPYQFDYHIQKNGLDLAYATMATDRWGNFQDATLNLSGMNNEEFPYTQQNKTEMDQNVSVFNLKRIVLPSGGIINVEYESDDYAYVQDKEATVMKKIVGFFGGDSPQKLRNAKGFEVTLDSLPPSNVDQTKWFKDTYLNGSDYIYVKASVKISNRYAESYGKDYDFVSAYCKIKSVDVSGSGTNAQIFFELQDDGVLDNPLSYAAWQKLKDEYPRYAFPGYENRIDERGIGRALSAVVSAIGNAVGNLSELRNNFYKRAHRKEFANEVNLNKTFVKLAAKSGKKLGGGLRVKKITINDEWNEMTSGNSQTSIYGQSYTYTTFRNGKEISSGVAAFEPQIGSDENALREPILYNQKIKGGVNSVFQLEKPFGEAFFPAPQVVYSRVVVKDLGPGGVIQNNPSTGSIVNEFYTAKDFPVLTSVSPLRSFNPGSRSAFGLLYTRVVDEFVLSQGYCFELNDMHGKPKAERVLNSSGAEISSTVYHYHVEDDKAERMKLKNVVLGSDQYGIVYQNKVLGENAEFFVDMREQRFRNSGVALEANLELITKFLIPIPIPIALTSVNEEYRLFRSATGIKIIQRTGILKSIVKTQNGSSISTENLLFDINTGQPIVTRTQNEFNQYIYQTNIPAYWIYPKMGAASRTLGTILKDVVLNNSGEINGEYRMYVTQGDQLVDMSNGKFYWALNYRIPRNPFGVPDVPHKILIDELGQKVSNSNWGKKDLRIVRSGFKNQLDMTAASFVSMEMPIKNGQLVFASAGDLSAYKLIQASAVQYSDEWAMKADVSDNYKEKNTDQNYYLTHPNLTNTNGASIYGSSKTRIMLPGTEDFSDIDKPYFNKKLLNVGVFLADNDYGNTLNKQFGFEQTVHFPRTGVYFIGFAGDNEVRVFIDEVDKIGSYNDQRYWTLLPIYVEAGDRKVRMMGRNLDSGPTNNNFILNPGAAGIEIYDNTYSELYNTNSLGSNINMIYSSLEALNHSNYLQTNLNYFRQDQFGVLKSWIGYVKYFNPYVRGFIGNWKESASMVFQDVRVYQNLFTNTTNGLNLANTGYLKNFKTYWSLGMQDFNPEWEVNLAAKQRWVTNNEVKLYDRRGQPLEQKDPLNVFSAAIFSFNGQLPAVVAKNAKNREIYFESFEDASRLRAGLPNATDDNEFENVASGSSLAYGRNTQVSHTGHFSALLPQTNIKLNAAVHNKEHRTHTYFERDNFFRFVLKNEPGLYPKGFEPQPDKTYLFTAWVKDNQRNTKQLQMSMNLISKPSGAVIPINLTCKAVIEGWKMVEGSISVGANDLDVDIVMKATAPGVYIDDIRIQPIKAMMKTYVYDHLSLRLLAEQDENTFSTLYEYDEEGQLIRVKKETERGIVTLKETRASYRVKK